MYNPKIQLTTDHFLFHPSLLNCQPVGDDRFREQIELKYGIRIGQMSRGRPRKSGEDELYK